MNTEIFTIDSIDSEISVINDVNSEFTTTIPVTTTELVTEYTESFEYNVISHLKCIVTILAVFLIILIIKLVHDLFNNLLSC